MASEKVSLSFMVTWDIREFHQLSLDMPLHQVMGQILLGENIANYVPFVGGPIVGFDKTLAEMGINTANALYILLGEDIDGRRWAEQTGIQKGLHLSLKPDKDTNEGFDIEIPYAPFVIGRDRQDPEYMQHQLDLDMRNDLPARYRDRASGLSRRQAFLGRDGHGEWFVQLHDLASVTMRVDGEEIKQLGQPVSLAGKDELEFGGGLKFQITERMEPPRGDGVPVVIRDNSGEFIVLPNSVKLEKVMPKVLENFRSSQRKPSKNLGDHFFYFAHRIDNLNLTLQQLRINPYQDGADRDRALYLINMGTRNELLLFLPNNDTPLRLTEDTVLGRKDPNLQDPLDIDMNEFLSTEFVAANMSRRQARFMPKGENEGWSVVLHERATAPMFIDGRQVQPHEETKLRDGASIEFGATNVLGRSIQLRVQYP